MSKDLLNLDIIVPDKNIVQFIGKVSKLNIFEFSGSSEFEKEGLFSTNIFGSIGSNTRNETFGYIDLGVKILHPLVYDYLLSLGTFYTSIIQGKSKAIFKDGNFIEDENGRTGLYFFIEYLPDLILEDNGSDQRKNKIDLIRKYGNKKDLTQYLLVLPAGLRDYTLKDNNTPSEDEINNMYRTILSISNTLKNINIDIEDESVDLYNTIVLSMHDNFLKIYLYIKDILDGKNGLIQNKWSKRSVKFGTRNVITPSTNLIKDLRDKNNHINPTDTVIGLHQFIGSISPIAKKYLTQIMTEVFDVDSSKAYLYNKNLKLELTDLNPKDKKDWVSYEGLDNLIEKFSQDDYKFLPVKIANKYVGLVRDDGKNISLHFNEEIEIDKFVRPLTYIELFYIAIYDVRKNFPGMLTRFPVDGMKSSYLTTFFIKTTIEDRTINYKHGYEEKVMYNYPILNKKPFNSLSPHYTRLEGIGGDHDGDMVSVFAFFSEEAINETHETLTSLKYILNPNGGLMTSVSIAPAENIIMHLTDTFKSDKIILSYQDLVKNTSKEKVNKDIINIYNKSFNTSLNEIEIEKWLENDDTIYLVLDQEEKIYAYIRIKFFNKRFLNKDNEYVLYSNTNDFIFISDLASIKKGMGKTLLDYLHRYIATGQDILLKARNKELITYYEQFGYNRIISTLIKGNLMVRYGDDN